MGRQGSAIANKHLLSGSASWVAIFGAALFWAWMDRAMFDTTLVCLASSARAGDVEAGLPALVILALSIPALIAAILYSMRTSERICWKAPTMLAMGAVGTLASFAMIASSNWSGAALHASAAIVGVVMGFMLAFWAQIAIAQGSRKTLIHVSGAWALGLVINSLLELFIVLAGAIITACLPLLSALLYMLLYRNQHAERYRITPQEPLPAKAMQPRSPFAISPIFIGSALLLCTVFGLMYGFELVSPSIETQTSVFSILASRGAVSLIFFCFCLSRFHDRIDTLFTVLLSLMVLGLMAMTIVPRSESAHTLVRLLVPMGYAAFDILLWATASYYGSRSSTQPAFAILVGLLAEQVGILLGESAGALIGDYAHFSNYIFQLILSYLTVMGVIALTRTFSRLKAENEAAAQNALESASDFDPDGSSASSAAGADALASGPETADSPLEVTVQDDGTVIIPTHLVSFAEARGLTPREKDVFALLSTGRSAPYIAEKLFLSENTVKTHVRHVYTKCGVHNKQELLDLLRESKELA